MKKYILILFICFLFTGCSKQIISIEKETVLNNDSEAVIAAKTIKNKFLEYKNNDVFFINTVAVDDDVAENTMIRKDNKELYVETDSQYMILYKEGINYLYDIITSTTVPFSDVKPEHENEEIINPFIDKYVNILDWAIENKNAFSLEKTESTENDTFFQIYTFTGKDNDWIKMKYDETYGLFDFWQDKNLTFKIEYILDKDDNLIQYFWHITDKDESNTMETEGKMGRTLEDAYSEIGYDLDGILKSF